MIREMNNIQVVLRMYKLLIIKIISKCQQFLKVLTVLFCFLKQSIAGVWDFFLYCCMYVIFNLNCDRSKCLFTTT